MTTKLTSNVVRDTGFDYRGKKLIVELTAQGVTLRLARQRAADAVFVGYEAIYELGCKLQMPANWRASNKVSRGLLKVGG